MHGSVQNIGIKEFQSEKYRSFIGNIFENIGELQDEWIDVNAHERGQQINTKCRTTSLNSPQFSIFTEESLPRENTKE